MKRFLIVAGLMGLSAVATYLVITRQMAENRGSQLNEALLDAEARIVQLEGDIATLEARLAQISEAQQQKVVPRQSPSARSAANETPAFHSLSNRPTDELSQSSEGRGSHQQGLDASPSPVFRFVPVMASGSTNLVRLEGTSSIHPWRVESRLIGGMVEMESLFGKTFSDEELQGRPLNAKLNCFVPVRSLSSRNEDGSPYSLAMDDIMYRNLNSEMFNRLTYSLSSLKLKERSTERAGAFVCEAQGRLAVAGKTNNTTMLVTLLPLTDRRVQFTGTTTLKMTDFGITPPTPTIAGGAIRTGDEVTLRWAWDVERR